MTALADRTELPPFNGEPVSRTSVKFTGAGTGFNGLDVKPVVMELDDEMYFVMRVTAAESASHFRDANDLLVRMQRLHIEEMAPVGEAIAVEALRSHAQEIEQLKAIAQGQDDLFAEQQAADREAKDGIGAAADIATDAAERVKAGR